MATVDLTPEGMKTPEGRERVHEALNALEQASLRVSETAREVLPDLDEFIGKLELMQDAFADYQDLVAGLREAIGRHRAATDTFLRAVAGRPA